MDSSRLAGESAPRDGYTRAEGAALYFRDVGQGLPIIVLHGGPSFGHAYLLPDLDRLADRFRLIYYDQRGRGKSAQNVQPSEITIQSEMADLETLRASMRLERVALLGHSWGGLLALEYALRHPERVSHLILLNTAPASHDDGVLFVRERAKIAGDDAGERLRTLESRPGFADGEDLEARAEYYRVYFRTTLHSPDLLDRLIANVRVGWSQEGIVKSVAVGNRLWHEAYEVGGYNLLPQLTRLHIPTLVLRGDYDFIPLACATHIAEAIPGAQFVIVPDCGHFSYLERPSEVRQALTAFFQAS
jgi:proline iminopeptidase